MIGEHTFITTLDGPDAFQRIGQYLAALDFKPAEAEATGVDAVAPPPGATRAVWARGPRKPSYSPLFRKQQMRIAVDFDRGRVDSAISVEHPRRPHKLAPRFAFALLENLELAAGGHRDPEPAAAPLLDLLAEARRRDFRRRLFIALVVIPLFLLLIVFAILAITRSL